LQRWLDAFGVVVIADELGGYAHNAALHVVGPQRTLLAIHDLADLNGAVETIRRTVAGTPRNVAAR
jgi:protein SCO1/2